MAPAHLALSLSSSSSAFVRAPVAPSRATPSSSSSRRAATVVPRAALPGSRGHFRAPKFTRDLGEWSTGKDVQDLQKALGTYRQDGIFGQETVAAVKLWQRANDVEATGYFGPISRAKWSQTNGGVRPAWNGTASAVVVAPPAAAPIVTVKPSTFNLTGPAILGGFVLAAFLKAQDDPARWVEDVVDDAADKVRAAWSRLTGRSASVPASNPLARRAWAMDFDAMPEAIVEKAKDWKEYENEADTRVWSWGAPSFSGGSKPNPKLNVAVAASMRGPSMAEDLANFDTLDFSDFARPSEVDPDERRARLAELDQKFRERREQGAKAVTAFAAASAPPPRRRRLRRRRRWTSPPRVPPRRRRRRRRGDFGARGDHAQDTPEGDPRVVAERHGGVREDGEGVGGGAEPAGGKGGAAVIRRRNRRRRRRPRRR